jgi:hypothetical protein
MAEDAVARTLGGSHAEIGMTIRLMIASPVHLVGMGWPPPCAAVLMS